MIEDKSITVFDFETSGLILKKIMLLKLLLSVVWEVKLYLNFQL